MGLKKLVKKAVKVVSAPIVKPIQIARDVVTGDLKGAVDNTVKLAGRSSPVGAGEYLTGTNITGMGGLAAGDTSSDNLKRLGTTALVAGGAAVGGAAGAGVGLSLSKGNFSGAASQGFSAFAPELQGFIPEEVKGYKDPLKDVANMFKPAFGNIAPSIPGGNSAPSVREAARTSQGVSPIALMALAAGAFFVFKFARRK